MSQRLKVLAGLYWLAFLINAANDSDGGDGKRAITRGFW